MLGFARSTQPTVCVNRGSQQVDYGLTLGLGSEDSRFMQHLGWFPRPLVSTSFFEIETSHRHRPSHSGPV